MDNGQVGNLTQIKCLPTLDREWFYLWMLIPSAVAILIAMALTRRSKMNLMCCYGKPGLASVGNLLDGRTHRLAYAASFGLVGSALINLFYGFFPFPQELWFDRELWVPALWGVVAVAVYAVDFFPLFACITLAASGIGFGYFMGTFFAWAWLASLLDEFFECESYKNIDPAEFLIIFDMPALICATFLAIWFPVGLLLSMCNGTGKKDQSRVHWYDKLTIQALEGRKRKSPVVSCGLYDACKSVCYIGIPGFRYSTIIVSTAFVSFCILYKIYCMCMIYLIPAFGTINIGTDEEIDRTLHALKLDSFYPKDNITVVAERMRTYFNIMEACLIVAVTVAFAICVITLGFIMSNYRANILAMYKGIRLVLPPKLSRKSPGSYAEASMKYIGYQVVFMAFGFVVQAVVLFVVAFLLAFVFFIPVLYGWGLDVLLKLCFTLGPWAFLAIIVLIGQACSAYKYFIQRYEGKPTLSLNNRRSYYNCYYFMFFFEFFWGYVVAVFRMIQGIFYGCVLISRCDLSMLNWRFEHQDVALQSYVAMLQVEVAHSHPIVLSCCKIMMRPILARWRNRMIVGDVESGGNDNSLKRQMMRKRILARNRWHLAYTLYWNPMLKHLRKQRIKLRAERRKGGPRMTTMSTQTPRHIAIQTKPEDLLMSEYYPSHAVKTDDIQHDFSDINQSYHDD
ncbi:receptor for retinol uptake stra6-like isoform X1 [Glandiceps talaboti]